MRTVRPGKALKFHFLCMVSHSAFTAGRSELPFADIAVPDAPAGHPTRSAHTDRVGE
jgi:hypothetical protein